MRNVIKSVLFCAVLSAFGLSQARAGLLLDHPRHPYGGYTSDTDILLFGTEPAWEILADDFVLADDSEIHSIKWLGFYGGQQYGSVLPPVGPETMRIRIHDARISDGLPGSVLYQESFLNPLRQGTGRFVVDSRGHPEYSYSVDLGEPFQATAGKKYWLEIAQEGSGQSEFRWEFSEADLNGQAVANIYSPDWFSSLPTGIVDNSFQLWGVPEPSSGTMTSVFMSLYLGLRGRRRRMPPCAPDAP